VIPASLDLEHRAALELRADGSRIVGLAIPFNSRSRDLGGFVEIVRPQAVTRSLSADVVALYNHEPGAVLGRTPTTLQLRTEDRGLTFTITPPDTQTGRDTLTLVSRGDLKGASFGFRTIADAWSREGDTTIRELLDIEIAEISLTAFPAYQQTDVAIAQRSLQAWQGQRGRSVRWVQMRHRV
jgi:HK97 family phage prohead protease